MNKEKINILSLFDGMYCGQIALNRVGVEYERLQTLPEGYTNLVSVSQAKKMIGSAWTVDVIAHIFSYLK
jgi:hypothetical protein